MDDISETENGSTTALAKEDDDRPSSHGVGTNGDDDHADGTAAIKGRWKNKALCQSDDSGQAGDEAAAEAAAGDDKEASADSSGGQTASAGHGVGCISVVQELFREHGNREKNGTSVVEQGDWSRWKPIGKGKESQSLIRSPRQDEDWPWDWRQYCISKDSTLRVELTNQGVRDRDLPSLLQHLDGVLQRQLETQRPTESRQRRETAKLNLDLSCNDAISDWGVTTHLAPFLHRWPACSRLKLYKTSIGDKALESLGSWISLGFAHELHLSDLKGSVTGDGAYRLLKQVQNCGNYPFWNDDGARCALWLRLEYNGIRNPSEIVSRGKSEGMSLAVLEKSDLSRIRPGSSETKKGQKATPAVNLVLFQAQERRDSRRKGSPGTEAEWNATHTDADWNATNADADWNPTTADADWKGEAEWKDDADWNDDADWKGDADWNASGRQASGSWDENQRYNGAKKRKGGADKHDWSEPWWSERHPDHDWREAAWGGQRELQPKTEEQRNSQLAKANEVLDAIDVRIRDSDPQVHSRWREHLEHSDDPVSEATRIVKMVGQLCYQGYNGSWNGASPSMRPSLPTGLLAELLASGDGPGLPPSGGAVTDASGTSEIASSSSAKIRGASSAGTVTDAIGSSEAASSSPAKIRGNVSRQRELANLRIGGALPSIDASAPSPQSVPHRSPLFGAIPSSAAAAPAASAAAPSGDDGALKKKKGKNKIGAAESIPSCEAVVADVSSASTPVAAAATTSESPQVERTVDGALLDVPADVSRQGAAEEDANPEAICEDSVTQPAPVVEEPVQVADPTIHTVAALSNGGDGVEDTDVPGLANDVVGVDVMPPTASKTLHAGDSGLADTMNMFGNVAAIDDKDVEDLPSAGVEDDSAADTDALVAEWH